jgi:hypothetical protein
LDLSPVTLCEVSYTLAVTVYFFNFSVISAMTSPLIVRSDSSISLTDVTSFNR